MILISGAVTNNDFQGSPKVGRGQPEHGGPRMRRSAVPKAVGITYATTIAARRGLGEVTADTLSPRGKRGEVKNPPLLKPWSLLHL